MCGRSSLTKTEKEIEARFQAKFYTEELERYNPLPNYNVAPTQFHPVIQMQDAYHLSLYRWGLIPSWAKDESIGAKMINARAETLLEKTAFKRLLASKRCIIPLDGFYEWKTIGKTKIPYRIVTRDLEIFTVAGLYDIWLHPTTKEALFSFTIITIPANQLMKEIHDRMPVILPKENEKVWLAQDLPVNEALTMLCPYPSDAMRLYEVSDKVNSVKNNDSSLILPKKNTVQPIQTSLF
ncbi:MAG: SOS response-associated peptidase [Saprospiraceae bacterium]|nr:SOS response-associated peptidase [Saprospiraceae bacterium]